MASINGLIRHYFFNAPIEILEERRDENPYLLGRMYKFLTRKQPPYFLRKHSIPFLCWKMFRKFLNVSIIPFIPFNFLRIILYRFVGYRIGSNVFIGMRCYLDDVRPELLTIGDYVAISFNVKFAVHGLSKGAMRVRPIVIEDNVMIGLGSIILAGVTIGKGSHIGAGAVIYKSIPPGVVVAAVPARVLLPTDDVKIMWNQ